VKTDAGEVEKSFGRPDARHF